jgi:DNA modification methylase
MSEDDLSIDTIVIKDRIRKDFGNLDELANSIREVGLIQPIVVTRETPPSLLAGERRLRAMQKLGIKTLVHAKTFIYNDEVDDVKKKAIECEENIRRKALTWQEEVLAKKRLLEIMQQIHGVAGPGHPSRSDSLGITSSGFGINKLANLLGESNAQTSKDIELARLIEAVPDLGKAETKEAARRQAVLGTAVAVALAQAAQKPQQPSEQKWRLIEGDFSEEFKEVEAGSVDLVITDPPFGEDVAGMGPNSKQLLTGRFDDSLKATEDLLFKLALHSYRVLKSDRFAVFFFGFACYPNFVRDLRGVGFDVDTSPLIWVKNTVINTSPYTRYGRSYEPILLARKGLPKMMRPSQRDVIQVDTVLTKTKEEMKFYHTQKPIALIEKFILDLTPPETTICDFCAGSGTTGVAALNLKRYVVLFEKDGGACQIIRTRLQRI